YITPWATGKRIQYTEFLSKQQTNIFSPAPGVFRENDSGRNVFYLDHYSLVTGYAKDIFIQYIDSGGLTYNITSTEGKIENKDGLTSLTLKNGHRYQISSKDDDKYSRMDMSFEELTATIKQNYNPSTLQNNSIDTSSVQHLVTTINKATNPNAAKAELSWRISVAVMMFVMTFLSVPMSIQTGRVQGNFVFILPPLIYAIYNNAILTLNGYVGQGVISSIFIVQLVHIIIILIGILLTYFKTYPKGYFFSKSRKLK
ncbi:MAG: LptF/LptG family permease, partial [Neisseriaceae bacterium]